MGGCGFNERLPIRLADEVVDPLPRKSAGEVWIPIGPGLCKKTGGKLGQKILVILQRKVLGIC